MTNKFLLTLIQEFLASRDNITMDEWYTTSAGVASEVMEHFVEFLKSKGLRF